MSGVRRKCVECSYTNSTFGEVGKKQNEVSSCPMCGGAFVDIFHVAKYISGIKHKNDNDKLLVIQLEDEASAPKVFYRGKEVTNKVHVSFDWDAENRVSRGGLTYDIEHYESGKGYPSLNRIERRVNDHA